MKVRTLLMVIALIAVAAFVALNWNAIMTPTTLSLGVASVQGPLGFVMLGLLTLFSMLFLVLLIYTRTSGFFRERHHAREMHAVQELADDAEASRFTELRELLTAQVQRQEDLYSELRATMLARLDQFDSVLRSATDHA